MNKSLLISILLALLCGAKSPAQPCSVWAKVGLTEAQFLAAIPLLKAENYVPIDLKVYLTRNGLRVCSIWDKQPACPWELRWGMDEATFQRSVDSMVARGMTPIRIHSYVLNGQTRHGAVWHGNRVGIWHINWNMTPAFYKEQILSFSQTRHLAPYDSHTYVDGNGQMRVNAIWYSDNGLAQYEVQTALTSTEIQATYDRQTPKGYVPCDYSAFMEGDSRRQGGIWQLHTTPRPAWVARNNLTPDELPVQMHSWAKKGHLPIELTPLVEPDGAITWAFISYFKADAALCDELQLPPSQQAPDRQSVSVAPSVVIPANIEVQNVAFTADRGDVIITYDLKSNANQGVTIAVLADMAGNGSFQAVRGAMGAVGTGILPGTGLRVVWPGAAAKAQLGNGEFPQAVFRVSATVAAASSGQERDIAGEQFTMMEIPAGTFLLGSNEGKNDEKPIASVSVGRFLLADREVTQALWEAIMGRNPSYFDTCPECPVEQVSWEDCQRFLLRLNQQTGRRYRLPTEAEWEYAAREGGTNVRYGNGAYIADPATINFDARFNASVPDSIFIQGEYRQQTIPVRSFAPNALGLYDMSGNVAEWCQDRYGRYMDPRPAGFVGPPQGEYRVARGGDWRSNPRGVRASYRMEYPETGKANSIGLRLAEDF